MWYQYITIHKSLIGVLIGIVFGIIARLSMLRSDYRQYPTYPHGKIIHIALGIIASALGAIAVPALYEKNYTAITFLTLAAQQFRDVRSMERETLSKIDSMELVSRGSTYIEGTAMLFEGRNYLVIMSALLTSLFSIMLNAFAGVAMGLISLVFVYWLRSGKNVGHIAEVESAAIRMEGPDLYVGDIYLMNIGLASNQEIIRDRGIGLILKPINANAKVTLSNLGQRQALLYDLSTILGIYRDDGEPALIPITKLDMRDGRVGVFLIPQEHDAVKALEIARKVPVLEGAVRMPSKSVVNQKEDAADNG